MPSITVRNVPPDVHDELAARAAQAGRSLQEHLLVELTELVRKPSVDQVLARAREEARSGPTLSADQILALRDADRR
jgi:plasmid stability protein